MWICASMQRISQFHQFTLGIQSIRVQRPDWLHPLLTMPNQKILTFNFCDFVSTWNNYTVSLICSGEMVDLKILEYDLLRPFWPISQKQDFPKYRICAGRQQIQIFIIEQIQWKLLPNICLNSKQPYFWPIFHFFFFSKKFGSVMHNMKKISSTMPKFRET